MCNVCYPGLFWLNNYLLDFKPVVYKGSVYDTLSLFKMFLKYFHCQNSNTKYIFEIEKIIPVYFLIIKSLGRRKIFYCIIWNAKLSFTSFERFIPLLYNSNLLNKLLSKAFNWCSSFELFHEVIVTLEEKWLCH